MLEKVAGRDRVDDVLESRKGGIRGFDLELESKIFQPAAPPRLAEGRAGTESVAGTDIITGRHGHQRAVQVTHHDNASSLGVLVLDGQSIAGQPFLTLGSQAFRGARQQAGTPRAEFRHLPLEGLLDALAIHSSC